MIVSKGGRNLYKKIRKIDLYKCAIALFVSGFIIGNVYHFIDFDTREISTEEINEDKSIVEIVREGTPSIVGVESECSQGTIRASGIIFDQGGYIITNAHSVEAAKEIYVYLENQNKRRAIRVTQNKEKDLAIIKIEEKGLASATFGDSDKLEVGEVAIAIGNPLGRKLSGTVTVGVISALNRQLEIEGRRMRLLQTDAAINSGNSGGALLNSKGEVIGLNTYHIPPDKAAGIGFSIPSNEVVEVIKELMESRRKN